MTVSLYNASNDRIPQSAGKISSPYRGDGTTLSDAEYERKVSAGAHIDELAQVSRSQGKTKSDVDDRHGEFASGGWDYRDAYFLDFDGKYYLVHLSAAIGEDGKVVYNIGQMQERSLPTVDGSSAKGGALNGEKTSLNGSVAQDGGTVKGKIPPETETRHSIKGSERVGELTEEQNAEAAEQAGESSDSDQVKFSLDGRASVENPDLQNTQEEGTMVASHADEALTEDETAALLDYKSSYLYFKSTGRLPDPR